MRLTTCMAGVALSMALVLAARGAAAADPPAAPKLSTFAPASDLVRQTDYYLGRLDESLASESQYKEDKEKITKDGNTLILIALALGLDDRDNKYKEAAPGVERDARRLAKATTYAAAKAALADTHRELSAPVQAYVLGWDKASASLAELMKQVPLINARLKRNLKNPKRFALKAKDTEGDTATLADRPGQHGRRLADQEAHRSGQVGLALRRDARRGGRREQGHSRGRPESHRKGHETAGRELRQLPHRL